MGQTIVEKIAQLHLAEGPRDRPLRAGDFVSIRPRHVMTHDNTSAVMKKFAAIAARRLHDSRQPVFALDHDIQNTSESNLTKFREVEAFARERGVIYVKLDGSVGILGNGAGLSMSTVDVVVVAGGRPANFCDLGGGLVVANGINASGTVVGYSRDGSNAFRAVRYDGTLHAMNTLGGSFGVAFAVNDSNVVVGYSTVNTLIDVIDWMLDKPGGYLSNDVLPPGIWLDNMPSFEFGVLTQCRARARVLSGVQPADRQAAEANPVRAAIWMKRRRGKLRLPSAARP